MIFKPFKQSAYPGYKWIFIVILILIPKFGISKYFQDYPFEKSKNVLIADSLLKCELYESAIDYYNKAFNKYQKNENWSGVTYTLNKIGWANIANFKITKGYHILQESLLLMEDYSLPIDLIRLDNYLYKGIYFNRIEKFDSSFYYHEENLKLRREILGRNSESVAESLRHYGQSLSDFGSLSQGEKCIRESIDIFENFYPPENFIFGRLYGTLSSILRSKYDYENAVIYAERSINILKKAGDSEVKSYVVSLITLGNIHNSFKKFDKAHRVYNETLSVIKDNPQVNKEYLIYSYSNLAFLYNQVNKPDSALYYVELSKELLIGFNLDDIGFGWTSWFDLIAGEAYSLKYDYNMAKNLVFNTLRIYENLFNESSVDLATINHVIAQIYQRLDNSDSALFYYQKALIEFLPDFDDRNIFSNPDNGGRTDVLFLYDLLYGKADVFRNYFFNTREEKYLKAALEIYNLIDKINDDIRNSKMAEGSLLVLNEYYQEDFEKGVDCSYLLYSLSQDKSYHYNGFNMMEKSKYMLLFKSLTLAESYEEFNLPKDLKSQEDSLKSHYVSCQILIDIEYEKDSTNPAYIRQLEGKKASYGIAMDEFRLNLLNDYQAYIQIKYDSLSKSYEDFVKYCNLNKSLGIEYYWGQKAIYVISTRGDGNAMHKINISTDLKSSLRKLFEVLSKGYSMDSELADFTTFINSSNAVYEYILKDILVDHTETNDLLIIPDGPLSQLPFEVLLTREEDSTYVDYKNLSYLINEFQTGYAYSLNLLLNDWSREVQSTNKLLAFSYSSANSEGKAEGRSGDQEELHHTAIELRAIRKEMGRRKSKYYYDLNATEHKFKMDASDYHLIHLAVHGEADTTSAMNTKLIFKNELDSLEDGQLYMHELYSLDLSNAELAVLSACETGIGKSFTGEGVFSMARGFAYAGCPSIVMSLWRVDDRNTAELMEYFYKNLNNGKSIVESLNNSKRKFISNSDELGSHPSNWAAFVPIGKNSVIEKRSYTIYYIILLIIAVSIFVVYTRIRK